MAKINYSATEFELIKKTFEQKCFDSLEMFEDFAKEIKREPLSLYLFVIRKLDIEVFADPGIKKQFREKYIHDKNARKKVPEKSYYKSEVKRIAPAKEEKPQPFTRPPANYTNFDVIGWANGLLDE